MSCHSRVTIEWTTVIRITSAPVEHAPSPRVGLVECGHGAGRSCALDGGDCVSCHVVATAEQTVRQQLREWCYGLRPNGATSGRPRLGPALSPCCAGSSASGRGPNWPWPWMPPPWAHASRCWPSAWSIAAVPVAWTILPANTQDAWRRQWLRMLRPLRPAIPRAGRSSYWPIAGCMPAGCFHDRRAWAGIPSCASTWGARFAPPGWRASTRCAVRADVGQRWQGTGTAFKVPANRPLHLAGLLGGGVHRPWLMLTDLPPEAADAGW